METKGHFDELQSKTEADLFWLFRSSSCWDTRAELCPCCPSRGTSVWPPDRNLELKWEKSWVTCCVKCFLLFMIFILHLLPRAQASSLPKKPPPMIVMDLMLLEILSKDRKSSIWSGENAERSWCCCGCHVRPPPTLLWFYLNCKMKDDNARFIKINQHCFFDGDTDLTEQSCPLLHLFSCSVDDLQISWNATLHNLKLASINCKQLLRGHEYADATYL